MGSMRCDALKVMAFLVFVCAAGYTSGYAAVTVDSDSDGERTSCAVTVNSDSDGNGVYAKDSREVLRLKYDEPYSGYEEEWGAVNCHDPKLFQDDDGVYYVYSTDAAIGGEGKKGLQIRRSTDLVEWECLGHSAIQGRWDEAWRKWVGEEEYIESTWAPTVVKLNGLYYMYHGIITDNGEGEVNGLKGSPVAAIALAIASSPTGPFYPAHLAAEKDSKIKSALDKIGVKYKQSILVRYTYYDRTYTSDDDDITALDMYNTASYDTQGMIDSGVSSYSGGFGCIDPEFVVDITSGKLFEYTVGTHKCYALTYGSWKGGIALIYVEEKSLKPVDKEGEILDVPCDSVEGAFGKCIAGGYGVPYEGAQVVYNKDTAYYYLFVSMGRLDYDYRVGVARSKRIEGPYIDTSGKSMTMGVLDGEGEAHTRGGKIIGSFQLEGGLPFRSQGGQSILHTADGKMMFACHTRTNFLPGYYFFLSIHRMFFTKDGWPIIDINEYLGSSEELSIAELNEKDIYGVYDIIVTERSSKKGSYKFYGDSTPVSVYLADAVPKKSISISLMAGGKIKGKAEGAVFKKWRLEGGEITIDSSAGSFSGYVLSDKSKKHISISALDAKKSGEYLYGNKR